MEKVLIPLADFFHVSRLQAAAFLGWQGGAFGVAFSWDLFVLCVCGFLDMFCFGIEDSFWCFCILLCVFAFISKDF